MKTIKLTILVSVILYCSGSGILAKNQSAVLQGIVLSDEHTPIEGATVALLVDNQTIRTTSTDKYGSFILPHPDETLNPTILITALGFEEKKLTLHQLEKVVILPKKILELPSIQVSAENNIDRLEESTEKSILTKRSATSLVSNNPISALRQPQLLKQGSAHSSKFRINGSVPLYFFNGNRIGDDPNHYGMFSVIPSSVVGEIKFYPSGTSTEYQSPTVLDIGVQEKFSYHTTKEFEFSPVQTTGTYSTGTEKYFVTGAVRKSVLDKLVKVIKVQSDRRTTPPTNFQDLIVTSGYKLSNKMILYINHLNSYDFLEYKTESTTNNKHGLSTFQHTDLNFTGLRLKIAEKNKLYNIEVSRKSRFEEYKASPPLDNTQGLDIYLTEQNYNYNTKFDFNLFSKSTDFKSGFSLTYTPQRKTIMTQKNWNFLSPDDPSNNPMLYQHEINKLYENITLTNQELNSAVYISVTNHYKNLKIENGFRFDKFSNLNHKGDLNVRTNLSYRVSGQKFLSVYFGTFSENPVQNVLENHQVLIREHISSLKPVHTKLMTLGIKTKSYKVSFFTKRISDIPEPVYDLSKAVSIGKVTDQFVKMSSSAQLSFYGADITFEKTALLGTKFDLHTFYGFTHADKQISYASTDYELNAPHKFYLELYYTISQKITLGTDFSFHSGYAFTPHLAHSEYLKYYRYSDKYINHISSFENSDRFPDNYIINFSCMYKVGESEFFLAVSNITNRKNPVVATSEGYVYDAGIMPTVGFKWKL